MRVRRGVNKEEKQEGKKFKGKEQLFAKNKR